MTWFLVAQIVLTLAVVAVSWYLSARSSGAATGGEDMSPSGLDSFSITTAEEGSVVPVVLGRARMKGNIIFDIDDAIYLPDREGNDIMTRIKKYVKEREVINILKI